MDGFNNGFPHSRSRGRGSTQGSERRDLRRPHDMPQLNPGGGGDMPQPTFGARPSSSTMPNYAAVVAGNTGSFGDSYVRNQNAALTNTNEEVNSTSRSTPTNDYANISHVPSLAPSNASCISYESSLSPYAMEFVPRTFRTPPTDEFEQNSKDESQAEYIVVCLNDFIYEVTLNPGKFDRSIGTFVQNLNEMVNGEASIKAIVSTIFDQATREPNFRYNAARLCSQLCVSCNFQDISFRSVLLNRCAHVFINRDNEAEQDISKLRGFVFFLGELYSQIKVNEQRIETLSDALPALFETLLSHPSPENYKCVCQMMKFTGPSLEDDEKTRSKNTPSMDKLISRLESSIPSAPREVQGMMSSVVQLRGCNWGRAVSPPSSHSETILADIPTEAVFYGPDGQPITNEEALFLESAQSMYSSQYETDEYGDDDDDDSEGMDDEIAAAFDEFLLQSGQKPN